MLHGMTIPARLSIATLGVTDVAASTAFYVALGWPLSSASVTGEVSFFATAGGLLGIFGHDALAADAMVPSEGRPGYRGVSLSINLDDRAQVDAALDAAVAAGVTLVKPARLADWGGYSGYFADPDGHLWEVAHNPFFPIGADQRPTLP